MNKLLILSLFLVGCARHENLDPRDIRGINPEFTSYVQHFESLYGRSIGDIPIQFAPQSGQIIGECVTWGQLREIKIDPDFWYNEAQDNDQRMSLIFHELGHCALNRGHLNTEQDYTDPFGSTWTGIQVSIMNAYIFFDDSTPYVYRKDYYLYELFNPAPGSPTLYNSANEETHYTDTKSILNH